MSTRSHVEYRIVVTEKDGRISFDHRLTRRRSTATERLADFLAQPWCDSAVIEERMVRTTTQRTAWAVSDAMWKSPASSSEGDGADAG